VPSVPGLHQSRRIYGWIGLLMLAMTFLPAPFADAGLLEFLR
jgi:hypothetical protein